MLYTASDAIDLAYRIIGKTSATYLNNRPGDMQRFRLMAMDFKELYRSAIKTKIKSVDEFERFFDNFNFTFMNPAEEDPQFIKNMKEFTIKLFFKKNDANYWISRDHAIDELKKIYDSALEKSFMDDKSGIDWTKTVRIVESRFLNFLNDKNIFFDNNLKRKLTEFLDSFNESESSNYALKYNNAIAAIKEASEFCEKYESDPSLQKFSNFQQDYESLKKIIVQFEKIYPNRSRDLSYDSLRKMIDEMPEDAATMDIDAGIEILKRIFYADYLYRHITTGRNALLSSKIAFISDNGGWTIDLEKPEVRNTYIALTQKRNVIEREIQQDNQRLNDDIAEVCLRLIALSLKDVAPEKFVNIEDNMEYEIPNKKIVSVFMYELSQLIKFHESGGQINSLNNFQDIGPGNNPMESIARQSNLASTSASSKANRLLDFENISGIVIALKSGYREIQDYPDTVVMRTIKFIAKLGETELLL